ncbi:hypothetical protein PR048_029526 [Dryococelus australis]|uniref:Uncharacterized protein n=1 Tax=Dryococelus australis TaxID=614101 RepID=A0ABQ9GDM2_9NEOP|nr:hypothetical protein PR048_029526 [Dryococelus australis]
MDYSCESSDLAPFLLLRTILIHFSLIGKGPRYLSVGIVPDNAACWRVFSVISLFPRPFIPALLHIHLTSPSSVFETSYVKSRPDLFTRSYRRPTKVGDCLVRPRNLVGTDSGHLGHARVRNYTENIRAAFPPPTEYIGIPGRGRGCRSGEPRLIPGRGHSLILVCGNRAMRCRWLVRFLADLLLSPLLHFDPAPYSPRFTLFGSQIIGGSRCAVLVEWSRTEPPSLEIPAISLLRDRKKCQVLQAKKDWEVQCSRNIIAGWRFPPPPSSTCNSSGSAVDEPQRLPFWDGGTKCHPEKSAMVCQLRRDINEPRPSECLEAGQLHRSGGRSPRACAVGPLAQSVLSVDDGSRVVRRLRPACVFVDVRVVGRALVPRAGLAFPPTAVAVSSCSRAMIFNSRRCWPPLCSCNLATRIPRRLAVSDSLRSHVGNMSDVALFSIPMLYGFKPRPNAYKNRAKYALSSSLLFPPAAANFMGRGGVVVRLLASHVGGPGSIPGGVAPWIFACGNRAGRCLWSADFLEDLPFPPALHSGTAPFTSVTLIGSQDLVVESRPNLFSHSLRTNVFLLFLPDDAGRRVFSGILRFPRPFIPVLLHIILITLIGSQAIYVKSRANLSPPLILFFVSLPHVKSRQERAWHLSGNLPAKDRSIAKITVGSESGVALQKIRLTQGHREAPRLCSCYGAMAVLCHGPRQRPPRLLHLKIERDLAGNRTRVAIVRALAA